MPAVIRYCHSWLATLLVVASAASAQPALDERGVLAALYPGTPLEPVADAWRVGGREVVVLLDAQFQESREPRRLFVTQMRATDAAVGGEIGAVLFALRDAAWVTVAKRPDAVRLRPGSGRGAARLVRFSAGRRGFVIQETRASAAGSSSFSTFAIDGDGGFSALLTLPTDHRGAGAGAVYRGCGHGAPASLPCTRHATYAFERGERELDDLVVEIRVEVGESAPVALPTVAQRYVFENGRYRLLDDSGAAIGVAVEQAFADWLEGRAAPELGPAHASDSEFRLGYVATAVHVEGDRATADAVPIETAAKGGRGRIPVRLVRVDGAWRSRSAGRALDLSIWASRRARRSMARSQVCRSRLEPG